MNLRKEQFEQDSNKKESRKFMLDQLVKAFPEENKRRNLKVAFLTGPSLIEYHEIYEKANISPQNVYGIERDYESFKQANEENEVISSEKRINLYHGEDLDLIRREGKWDIINLDYLQNYGPTVIHAIDVIFNPEQDILNNEALVGFNLQTRRENKKYQRRMTLLNHYSGAFDCSAIVAHLVAIGAAEEKISDKLKTRNELLGYSKRILQEVLEGLDSKEGLKYERQSLFQEVELKTKYPLLSLLEREEIEDEAKTTGSFFFGKEEGDYVCLKRLEESIERHTQLFLKEEDRKPFRDGLKLLMYGSHIFPLLCSTLGSKALNQIYLNLEGILPKNKIRSGLLLNKLEEWTIENYSYFDYVSKSKSPMYISAFHVKKNKNILEEMLRLEPLNEQAMKFLMRLRKSNDSSYIALRNFLQENKIEVKELDKIYRFKKVLGKFRRGQEFIRAAEQSCKTQFLINKMLTEKNKNEMISSLKYLERRAAASTTMSDEEKAIWAEEIKLITENKNLTSQNIAQICAEEREVRTRLRKEKKTADNFKKEILSKEEKDTIRALALEGYAPKEIWKNFYEGTEVSLARISAVCAWNKIWEKKIENII